MTFVPPFDATASRRPRLPRLLDPVEVRCLGSLMEKQMTTPEYYPLTLNALVAACNQKSNREPLMELSEAEVQRALERLQDEKLVWKVLGGRAVRYDHNLDHVWHLDRAAKALITMLFLRGPQTPGELRGRSDRLCPFDTPAMVEEMLRDMSAHSEPLVTELARRPGQKEARWGHLASGTPVETAAIPARVAPAVPVVDGGEPLSQRVARLESQLERLEQQLASLREKLGE